MKGRFSYFASPISNTKPMGESDLSRIYDLIKSEKWAQTTERLRSLSSQEERRRYKAAHLDFVTFSGRFRSRRASALVEYSGLICIDIDHIESRERLEEMRQQLIADDELKPKLVFRSPSGDGLKLVIESGAQERHREAYDAAIKHIRARYQIEADHTPDVARACFLCYDPKAYFRLQITDNRVQITDNRVQSTDYRVQRVERGEGRLDDYGRIEVIVCRLESRRRDVTERYRDWFRIGLALASIFGEGGREFYHRISRFYPRYTIEETDGQYERCLRYTNHTTSIGTLIYLLTR
jgi:hypothetical protein